MKPVVVKTVSFIRMTVGSVAPVAEGSVETEPDGQRYFFSLCWKERSMLRVTFSSALYEQRGATQEEVNTIEAEILRQYSNYLCRALYGTTQPKPCTVLSANFKALRLGHEFTRETVARRLNVRNSTVSDMENGVFDFDTDIWRYVDTADSLLFRAAKLYHVPSSGVTELSSHHFFLRNQVSECSYDFGSKPFYAKLFSFHRHGVERAK